MQWWVICLHAQGVFDEISHQELLIKVMSPGVEGIGAEYGL